jgi:PAS domain S-box-containing protein
VTQLSDSPQREPRTQPEEASASGEESFRLIVETLPGLIAVMTADGGVEHVNRQVLEYFGRTLEELRQWGTTDAVHPADLPRVAAAWQHAVQTGQPYEFEHRIRRADGEYRWFQSRGLPLRDADGRVVRWYNLLTDIDARKQSEEKLRRSEADLLEAQRLSHSGSWRHDLASGAFFVSPEVLRIRGVASAEPLSTIDRMYSGIHSDDRSRVKETYEAAQRRKGEFDAEYRIVLQDGTIKHLHTIGHPVLNESGDVVEYVGTGMDVTEQRQAQAALETAFEEIKRLKDRLQDENLALREEIDRRSCSRRLSEHLRR